MAQRQGPTPFAFGDPSKGAVTLAQLNLAPFAPLKGSLFERPGIRSRPEGRISIYNLRIMFGILLHDLFHQFCMIFEGSLLGYF